MTLRARLTLLVALSVAVAVVVASLAAYFATRNRLVNGVDATLGGRAQFVAGRPFTIEVPPGGFVPPDRSGGETFSPSEGAVFVSEGGLPSIDVIQVADVSGEILSMPSDQVIVLPVNEQDLAVAAGTQAPYFRTVALGGDEYRVFATRGPNDTVILAGRSLAEVNNTLADLRNILIVVSLAGVGAATLVGLVVAHRSLAPVTRLTAAAEHIAVSQDLSHTIDVSQTDEIGRLAGSFNTMLRALDASKRQQQQLVMDASHELRTPLTSLRTNIEVLTRGEGLPADDKRQLLDDVNSELEELTTLVGELVELATEPSTAEAERVDVRLDEVVERVVERARRRSGLEVALNVEPTIVVGSPALLERAAGNLVDNAIKWSPPDGRIDVTLRDGVVTVVDQGPGIPPEDQAHVFDRFYRSAAARSKPGSGLGLSIVRKIVESHGGQAFVRDGADGGTAAGFSLPHDRPEAG